MMEYLGMKDLLVQTKNGDTPLSGANDEAKIEDTMEDGEDEVLTVTSDQMTSRLVSKLDDQESNDIIENLIENKAVSLLKC